MSVELRSSSLWMKSVAYSWATLDVTVQNIGCTRAMVASLLGGYPNGSSWSTSVSLASADWGGVSASEADGGPSAAAAAAAGAAASAAAGAGTTAAAAAWTGLRRHVFGRQGAKHQTLSGHSVDSIRTEERFGLRSLVVGLYQDTSKVSPSLTPASAASKSFRHRTVVPATPTTTAWYGNSNPKPKPLCATKTPRSATVMWNLLQVW
mmetsp:Transcript_37322/g.111485  ORF Transcript_37322/g.111485 Transcript_37322/m.111485 type:complete len:207 (+) Transcript_37322:106-726(+)